MKAGMSMALALAGWLAQAEAAAPPQPADVDVTNHGLHVRTTGVTKDADGDVRDVIDQQIALTEDTTVTPPLADDLAFFVRQRYLDLGYADAKVDWEVTGDGALLHVVEGPKYKVGTVRYEGTSRDSKELTPYLLRRTYEKLKVRGDHPPFVAADIKDGANLVQRHFMGEGYLDAAVEEPITTARPTTGVQDVLVKVKEGKRYTFGTVAVTGELLGREEAVEEIVGPLREQPYNEVRIEDARTKITGIYERTGYYTAATTVSAGSKESKGGRIPVVFQVTPGAQFHVIGIELSPDLSRGAQRLARAGFKRGVGKVYSPEDIDMMHKQVVNSEVFARLDVTPRLIGSDTMVLEISGEEAKTRRYSAYAGYETFRGPILGVESQKVNWHDTGDTLKLKAEANGIGFSGGATLIDPAIFNSAFSLEGTIGGENEAVFDYERQTYLARATLSRQWNRHISSKLFLEGTTNEAESDELTPEELGPEEYNTASVGAAVVFDYRNSPLVPTDGWYTSVTVTGMGGDVNYVRTDAVFSVYQPLTKRLRVALGVKSSMIQTGDDVTEVPIDLRVFNGGANSVRSFPEREMGAKSRSGTPLGGLVSEVASLEFSYEMAANLELALFGDVGSLRPTDKFLRFGEFPDLRYAIGLGIRYKLPIGPLRVDYGWNPNRHEGEPFGALHITFGFAF
jgi:outer membrane protein assembly complex protein YaeT